MEEENSKTRKTFSRLSKISGMAKETFEKTKKAAADAGITGETIKGAAHKTIDTVAKAGSGAVQAGKKAADSVQGAYSESMEAVKKKLDQNGDGQVDVVDIILMALKVPGIRIDRSSFLQKELFKNHPQEVIDQAIRETPAKAGIPQEEIDKISDEVIKYERNCVSGISAALGMPGGVAMAATIPADIAQYYGYTLRAAQKLLYLYGFPDIEIAENELMLDTETINALTLCLGVMYGTAGANNAIKGMAKALAAGVEKQLLKKALTRGTVYPFVKGTTKWFGVKMTKQVFAGFFKKAIPVVGGVIGGGITFLSFKPCCLRLKSVLMNTMLSNPDHVSNKEEDIIAESIMTGEVIDAEFYPIGEDIAEAEENTDSEETGSEP